MYSYLIAEGRLTTDPLFYPAGEGRGKDIAVYTLACERDYKQNGIKSVDFYVCKAFDAAARFARDYYHKGDLVSVMGRPQNEQSVCSEDGKKYWVIVIYVKESHPLYLRPHPMPGNVQAEDGDLQEP